MSEYEAARAAPLTRAEREQIAASGTYLLAYVARCEQALGQIDGPFTQALHRHGPDYLVI